MTSAGSGETTCSGWSRPFNKAITCSQSRTASRLQTRSAGFTRGSDLNSAAYSRREMQRMHHFAPRFLAVRLRFLGCRCFVAFPAAFSDLVPRSSPVAARKKMHDPKNTLMSFTTPGNANALPVTCFLNTIVALRSALICFQEMAGETPPWLSNRRIANFVRCYVLPARAAAPRPRPPLQHNQAQPSIPACHSCTRTSTRLRGHVR